MTEPQDAPKSPPVLSVLRGEPTPDELAAMLVVLASRLRAHPADGDKPPSLWSSPAQTLQAPLFSGPGAWRASGLPR
jgi:Acyl-CoA carboxylase epsilon subunit